MRRSSDHGPPGLGRLDSRSGWVCVARDDQRALALARQAAIVEWAQPASRRPEDFSVEFVRFELERS